MSMKPPAKTLCPSCLRRAEGIDVPSALGVTIVCEHCGATMGKLAK